MSYFNAFTPYREDPVGAAIRADVSSQRRVVDSAHDYQSAIARGDTTGAAALQSKFREAWETDVRRRGGKPEDMIPGYPDYTPTPVAVSPAPWGFFGEQEQMSSVKLLAGLAIFYIFWTFLR